MEPLKEAYNPSDITPQQDAWEAYNTFRVARTMFFWLIIVGLLFTQTTFWLMHNEFLKTGQGQTKLWKLSYVISPPSSQESIKPNTSPENIQVNLWNTVSHILKIFNLVLPFAIILYCLSMLIGLKLALVGRLGGLANSGKAFFISLIIMVLMVPWQKAVAAAIPGTLFSFHDLLEGFSQKTADWWGYFTFYGRFVGLWWLSFLLLLAAQGHSFRAARKIRLRLLRPETPPQPAIPPTSPNTWSTPVSPQT